MTERKTLKAALLVLAVIVLLRLPTLWTPIVDVDESQFAGYANALLDGGTPYIASVDNKPLGIYWFYAAVFMLFGRNNMVAIHVVTMLWVGLTSLFCYKIAGRLYSPRAGFWAALFYAVFTTAYIPKFIATSIVIVMMLPLTASIYELLNWEETGKRRHVWLSGILWGIACLFKYQAGINLAVVGIYLLLFRPLYLNRSLIKANLCVFLEFVAAGAIVLSLFLLYLRAMGALDPFIFWSMKGSLAYIAAAELPAQFWRRLAMRGGAIIACSLLMWSLAAARSIRMLRGLKDGARSESAGCQEYLILIWLLLSIIPVCMGGRFYGHYFLQLYPALAILAAGETIRLLSTQPHGAVRAGHRLVWGVILAGLIIPAGIGFSARLLSDRIYAIASEENPNQYVPIAAYIREHTGKEDRIFVWGFATPIYIYSDRRASSRFLWCDWLTGRASGTSIARDPSLDTTPYITKGSWEMLFEDLDRYKPIYFVDTSPGNHHDYGKYPVSKYPALADFLSEHYVLETRLDGADLYRRTD